MRATIYRWPIRWKLLALMWVLALLPVLTVAWVEIKTFTRLGVRLATQTGQALSDQTRANLEQKADDYARLLAHERQLIELLVEIQAREATRVMQSDPAPRSGPIYWTEDFVRGRPELALQLVEEKYFQQSSLHSHSPLPVSYTAIAMHTAPGLSRAGLQRDAARLAGMLGMLRTIHAEQTDLVQWHYTTLENGLHASYPGHAGYPANFDPRTRSGYQTQKTRRGLVWSGPYRDVTSRLLMMSASVPLFDSHHRFIGATGVDVRLTRLLQTAHLPHHLEGASEILLTAIPKSARQGDQIEIIARQGETDQGGDWLEKPRSEIFKLDSDRALSGLVKEMRAGRNGNIRTRYRDRDTLCVYRKFDSHANYLLFLVPEVAASGAAEAAAEYALVTTKRQIDSLIPIALLAAALAAVAAYLGARAITGPIQRLSEAVQEVTAGNFKVRVDIRTGDELENLARGFNRMVPRIEAHAYMKKALIVAREVQQHLLPASAPIIPELDIHGICWYADETGGDYYDYLDLRARNLPILGIALGDVSGHGVASALLMATARALLHGSDLDPRQLGTTLQKLNQNLVDDVVDGRFMSLFILMFDVSAREITWASAGHGPVLCYREHDQTHFELTGNDIPLGVDRNWRYGPTGSQMYLVGDVFLLATDGAWEARSPSGECFGKQRLSAVLQRCAHLPTVAICDEISLAISRFRGGTPARDDLSLVVVKIRDPSSAPVVATG